MPVSGERKVLASNSFSVISKHLQSPIKKKGFLKKLIELNVLHTEENARLISALRAALDWK